jgi:hypothetical protein
MFSFLSLFSRLISGALLQIDIYMADFGKPRVTKAASRPVSV